MTHTRSLLSLALLSGSCALQAQNFCPTSPLSVESEQQARDAVRALVPLGVEEMQPSGCRPAVRGFMAVGGPLCLLAPELPAVAATYMFASEQAAGPIAVGYLIDFTEERHRALQSLLAVGRTKLAREDLPVGLRSLGGHEELTVAYVQGRTIVSLQKPRAGMPGRWFSVVSFEYAELLHLTRRDLNTCN